MVLNKRGWLRILEAFIGVMIIAGVLLFIFSNKPEKKADNSYIYSLQSGILDEIETNESLRTSALKGDLSEIIKLADSKIPKNIGFEIKICDLNDEIGCKGAYIPQEKFTKDKIIAANLTLYSPKKVRLMLWIK